MKVVLIDTGRGRNVAFVERCSAELGLTADDELALISWNHPRLALPVVDQIVFGPRLNWQRTQGVRPKVTSTRRVPAEPAGRASTAGLPWTDPRRMAAAVQWRGRRLSRAAGRRFARLRQRVHLPDPRDAVSGTSPLGKSIRRRFGVRSDGVATDFAIAAARSAQAAELAAWADVVVPYDIRSRKAAWMLARRVPGPQVTADVTSGARVIKSLRRR